MEKTISFKSIIYKKETETKRIKLWLDELPNLKNVSSNTFSERIDLNSGQQKDFKKLCIELSFLRHASNYALLGFEYIPHNGSYLEVDILFSDKNTEKYLSNHLFGSETKYCGLAKEYVAAIFDEIKTFSKNNCMASGKIIFKVAANCEIGSSELIFRKATQMLLKIFINNITDENEIKEMLNI